MPDETPKTGGQERAEAEVESFRKHLGPFVVAAETTRMAMVFTDAKAPGHPIVFANDSFLKLIGYQRDEVLGKDFNAFMVGCVDPETLEKVAEAFAGTSDIEPEIQCRRRDGSDFWASIFISPVRDEQGGLVQHFVSLFDLTSYKIEQAQSKMLIDELNHRVKNTLSTVQSIAWQALRSSSDPETIRKSIESRLFALSRSHDLLTQHDWTGAGLHDLIDAALEPFEAAGGRAGRLHVTGDNVRMPPRRRWRWASRFTNLRPTPSNTAPSPMTWDRSRSRGRLSPWRKAIG